MTKQRQTEPHWLTGTAFKLSIQCNHDAFGPTEAELRDELAGLLQSVALKILSGDDLGMYQTIFDSNGNDVGRYAVKDIDAQGNETFPQILR